MAAHEPTIATRDRAALEAYRILRLCFVVAPICSGIDKYFNLLTQWPKFLAPFLANAVPPDTFMRVAGVVEIAAGLLVLLKPRIGSYVVAAWLFAIIVNLLMIPGYFDVALRDFGLMLGALALARLSRAFG